MAKDAKGHGSDARGGPASYQNVSTKPLVSNAMRDRLAAARNDPNHPLGALTNAVSGAIARGEATPIVGVPAHDQGVAAVGQPQPAPNFRMNSFTHEIVDPQGNVAARMNLSKNSGVAVDNGRGEISRSSGPSIHDAVSMPDYRAGKSGSNSFPAEHIGGPLHFLTANDFAGHTVRRVKG